jgi:S-adenosyl-L-methionine hydrolase (adenosine-forming)
VHWRSGSSRRWRRSLPVRADRLVRITLLTDFGTRDGYVAAMKGAIHSVAPSVIIDDATHDIAPGEVHAAAWALAGYWRLYPPGVIHVAVVDPGVGSDRHAIAVEADGRLLVGPDNGTFTRVFHDAAQVRVVRIENTAFMRDVVSATFHGRDVFAPAAAHLALGRTLDELGPVVPDALMLELPVPRRDSAHLHGEVIHVDRFGNLVTNIPADAVTAGVRVAVCGRMCALVPTYAEAEPGGLVCVVGSRGMLEISVRDGSAADFLGAARGATVVADVIG